ncbi:hypothetical protein [Portibacter lacus]|uniref:Uncharacterized protein n=1 Tax=Portibacter lacus TaxID=1099794 RepID=A0AA37WD99_9BACT|nr:hypothetical protein [Portibacter lacus]GLR15717.1 hypothetical protein GCM10007940_03320 [Portibacter lacus]
MKAIKSYQTAWANIWKYRFPIAFLYLANIVFTFIASSPYTIYFKQKMQHSDVLDFYEGFDITMIGEFVNNYGQGLVPLMTLFIILVVFYYFFSIFANSAILYAVSSQNKFIPLRSFWNGGLNYYWKIMRLSLYYILSVICVVGFAWFVLLAVGINILEVENDAELARKIKYALIGILILIGIFSMIKQYAKLHIATKNLPFISSSILKSGGFVIRNFLQTTLLYLINIGVLVLFFILYVNVRRVINVDAWLLTFIIAQVYLLFKIVFRIVHLDSCLTLLLKLTKKK